jgi:DNA-binding ferritin-like protein
MNKTSAVKAISTLADCCACVSGNVHTIHLNYVGPQFDTMHKIVTQEYYEALDEDYDSLAEWARCYDVFVPNKNESAIRIKFQSIEAGPFNYETAAKTMQENFEVLVEQFKVLYNALNSVTDCATSIGVANWLQGRIEYWSKELRFFNANRIGDIK